MDSVTTTTDIKQAFQRHARDTGSSEVQVALLTERIKELTEHLKQHVKDHSSRRGLIALVNSRRRLLDYLKRTDTPRYQGLVKQIGLRH